MILRAERRSVENLEESEGDPNRATYARLY